MADDLEELRRSLAERESVAAYRTTRTVTIPTCVDCRRELVSEDLLSTGTTSRCRSCTRARKARRRADRARNRKANQ